MSTPLSLLRSDIKALDNRDLVNAYGGIQYDIGRGVKPFDDPRALVLWEEILRRLDEVNHIKNK